MEEGESERIMGDFRSVSLAPKKATECPALYSLSASSSKSPSVAAGERRGSCGMIDHATERCDDESGDAEAESCFVSTQEVGNPRPAGTFRGGSKPLAGSRGDFYWRGSGGVSPFVGGSSSSNSSNNSSNCSRVPALLKSDIDECVRINVGGLVSFPVFAESPPSLSSTETSSSLSDVCPSCGCSFPLSTRDAVAADSLLVTATLFVDGKRESLPVVFTPRPLRASCHTPLLFQRRQTPPPDTASSYQRKGEGRGRGREGNASSSYPSSRRILNFFPRPCVHSLVGNPPCIHRHPNLHSTRKTEGGETLEHEDGNGENAESTGSVSTEPTQTLLPENCACCGGIKTDCLGGLRFASLQQLLRIPSARICSLPLNAFFVFAVFAHYDEAPAFVDSAGGTEETTLPGSGWRIFGFSVLPLHDRGGSLRQGRLLLPVYRVLLPVPLLATVSKRETHFPVTKKQAVREELCLFWRQMRDVCAPPSLASVRTKSSSFFAAVNGSEAQKPQKQQSVCGVEVETFEEVADIPSLSIAQLLGTLSRQPLLLLRGESDATERRNGEDNDPLTSGVGPILPALQTLELISETCRLCIDLDFRQRMAWRPVAEPVEAVLQKNLQRSVWERLMLLQAEAQNVEMAVQRIAETLENGGFDCEGERLLEETHSLFGGFVYVEMPFYGVPVMHAEQRLLPSFSSSPHTSLQTLDRSATLHADSFVSPSPLMFLPQPWTLGRPVVPPLWGATSANVSSSSSSSSSSSVSGLAQIPSESNAGGPRLARLMPPVLPSQAARLIHQREIQTELEHRSRRQQSQLSQTEGLLFRTGEDEGRKTAEGTSIADRTVSDACPNGYASRGLASGTREPCFDDVGGTQPLSSNWISGTWGLAPLEKVTLRPSCRIHATSDSKVGGGFRSSVFSSLSQDPEEETEQSALSLSPPRAQRDSPVSSSGSGISELKTERNTRIQVQSHQLTWQDVSDHPCIAARIQRRIFLSDAASSGSLISSFPARFLAVSSEASGRQPELQPSEVLCAFRRIRSLLPSTAPLSAADSELLWANRHHLRHERGALPRLLQAANLVPTSPGSSALPSHPQEALKLLEEVDAAALSVEDVLELLLLSKELEPAAAAAAVVACSSGRRDGTGVSSSLNNASSNSDFIGSDATVPEGAGEGVGGGGIEDKANFAVTAAAVYGRVKRLAVEGLEQAPETELLFFLPQLVQLMRTDQHTRESSARVASVLVKRSLTSPPLASAFFWFLQCEKDHSQDGHLFVRAEQRLRESLERRKRRNVFSVSSGGTSKRDESQLAEATLRLLERQQVLRSFFLSLNRSLKAKRDRVERKTERLQMLLERLCRDSFAPLLALSGGAFDKATDGEVCLIAEKDKEKERDKTGSDAQIKEIVSAASVQGSSSKVEMLQTQSHLGVNAGNEATVSEATECSGSSSFARRRYAESRDASCVFEEGPSPRSSVRISAESDGCSLEASSQQEVLDDFRQFAEAVQSAIPLPFDPSLSLVQILSSACYVVKSSQYPLVIKGVVVSTEEVERGIWSERSPSQAKLLCRRLSEAEEKESSDSEEADESRTPPSSNAVSRHSSGSPVSFRRFLYKAEDDLRQDVLVLQLLSYMDRVLLRYGVDLKLTTYKVVAFSASDGMIEFLDGCVSFAQVKRDYKSLALYMASAHPDPQSPRGFSEVARENFIASCAGYCVATYLLGVGDRHLDNILLMPDGRMLHVDFGFILGEDPKPFPPPMKICSEMLEVLGALDSAEFSHFLRLCCLGFKYLRRHAHEICLLLECMVTSGLKDIAKNLAKVPDSKMPAPQPVMQTSEEGAGGVQTVQTGNEPPSASRVPSPCPKSNVSLGASAGAGAAGGCPSESSGTVASNCGDTPPGLATKAVALSFLPRDASTECATSSVSYAKGASDPRTDILNMDSKVGAKSASLLQMGPTGNLLGGANCPPSGAALQTVTSSGNFTFRASGTFAGSGNRPPRNRAVCVAIEKVRERFRLDLAEEEAEEFLVSVIISSAKALFPAVVDKLHEWSLYWK